MLSPEQFPYLPKKWVTDLVALLPDITYLEAAEILIPRWNRRKQLLKKKRLTPEEKKELL